MEALYERHRGRFNFAIYLGNSGSRHAKSSQLTRRGSYDRRAHIPPPRHPASPHREPKSEAHIRGGNPKSRKDLPAGPKGSPLKRTEDPLNCRPIRHKTIQRRISLARKKSLGQSIVKGRFEQGLLRPF
jgi:hypothetical protein